MVSRGDKKRPTNPFADFVKGRRGRSSSSKGRYLSLPPSPNIPVSFAPGANLRVYSSAMDICICTGLAIIEYLAATATRSIDADRFRPQVTVAALLGLHYLLVKYYRVFLYHKHFSPLRHLPGPKVRHISRGNSHLKAFLFLADMTNRTTTLSSARPSTF